MVLYLCRQHMKRELSAWGEEEKPDERSSMLKFENIVNYKVTWDAIPLRSNQSCYFIIFPFITFFSSDISWLFFHMIHFKAYLVFFFLLLLDGTDTNLEGGWRIVYGDGEEGNLIFEAGQSYQKANGGRCWWIFFLF